MASVVVVLNPRERLRDDSCALNDICDRLGHDTASRVVSGAIEELARSVAAMAIQVRLHDEGELNWQSRRLQKLALGLGLISLASVASDLRHSRADPTAFAAVCARLIRVASTSLAGLSRRLAGGQ